tara:strand:+ start:1059 stop:1412 length:354 start_codon:yes stop_codon:yes gene_type:complete
MTANIERPMMTGEQIKKSLADGAEQCIVEAQSDGTLCWDKDDSREREPVHNIKKGDLFWCWSFKETGIGKYTHDYANMAPTGVPIETNVELKLVYATNNGDDPALFETNVEKSPNIN